MFKYAITGRTNKRTRSKVLALTPYSDLAQFIADHAKEALDPDGKEGLTVEIVTRPEADLFIPPPRTSEQEE